MSSRYFLTSFVIGSLLLAACSRLVNPNPSSTESIHYHAGFQVYLNDSLRDFSDLKYMHGASCVEGPVTPAPVDDQIEKAHLHDGVGDVVHVHRAHAVWGDLFKNINYPIDSTASAYINGQPINNFLSFPIKPYDSLIIFEGINTDINSKLNQEVTKAHIVEIEQKSESCGSP
jgi:hypothetical protein